MCLGRGWAGSRLFLLAFTECRPGFYFVVLACVWCPQSECKSKLKTAFHCQYRGFEAGVMFWPGVPAFACARETLDAYASYVALTAPLTHVDAPSVLCCPCTARPSAR